MSVWVQKYIPISCGGGDKENNKEEHTEKNIFFVVAGEGPSFFKVYGVGASIKPDLLLLTPSLDFWPGFDQTFGQVLDQIFDKVFWRQNHKYSVQFYLA